MTERLYQSDPYITEFEGIVTAVVHKRDRPGVVLEATFFYPESGGQPCDMGTLGGISVESVVEDGDTIIHMLAAEPGFAPGDRVKCAVDWRRRFINMQQHTGQHILSQAFERVLGAHTFSSSLGTEHSTIDVSQLGLSWEDMARVEALANQVVYENRPVEVSEAGRGDAGDLRVKRSVQDRERGGAEGGKQGGRQGEKCDDKPGREVLRIVEVSGFDRSPCGGTHLRRTGETGPIKILRWEKVRDSTRVEFLCGLLAEADYSWKSKFVVELAQRLTTKDANVPGLVDAMIEDNKALRRETGRLKSLLAGYRVEELMASADKVAGTSIIVETFEGMELADLRQVAARAVGTGSSVALFCLKGDKAQFIFCRSSDVEVDMREAMKVALEVVGGRGGGKPEFAQGGGEKVELADEALDRALDRVRGRLADKY